MGIGRVVRYSKTLRPAESARNIFGDSGAVNPSSMEKPPGSANIVAPPRKATLTPDPGRPAGAGKPRPPDGGPAKPPISTSPCRHRSLLERRAEEPGALRRLPPSE